MMEQLRTALVGLWILGLYAAWVGIWAYALWHWFGLLGIFGLVAFLALARMTYRG